MWQPIIRVLLRYGVGFLAGWQVGEVLASDQDVVDIVSAGVALVVAAGTEWWYRRAKQTGGAT